jgi:hypothetical protein
LCSRALARETPFSNSSRRSADAERAMDGIRKKFGNAAVIRGIAYKGPEKPE